MGGGSVILFSFRATLIRTPKTFFSLGILPHTPKILSISRHHNRMLCASSSSSSAVEPFTPETSASSSSPSHRPWPEWVTFVDCLKSRGYLSQSTPSAADDGEPCLAHNDTSALKGACLCFARDRFDVFRSLSKEDIQALVEGGCPTVLRKVVNSAKRLRAYTGLDEADICSVCNLRESCDRAYLMIQESESAPRTVDIVRVLFYYALGQSDNAEGVRPAARGQAELSAKRLLLELIELSEEPPEPGLSKPPGNESYKKQPSGNIPGNNVPKKVEKGSEDWTCSECNFLNFSRNIRCLKCSELGPGKGDVPDPEMKAGDWICPECSFMNFSRNSKCLKCECDGPKKISSDKSFPMKKGDWNCDQCGYMNFARNSKCFRCSEKRPPRELNPGEWECPSCDFLNFRRNVACHKCQCERPKEKAQRYV